MIECVVVLSRGVDLCTQDMFAPRPITLQVVVGRVPIELESMYSSKLYSLINARKSNCMKQR